MCTEFQFESLKERDHLKDLGVDGRILQMSLKKIVYIVRAGLIWLRKGDRWRDFVDTVKNLWVA
jgi:hypothetical protein